jgi:hypothetical protein
MQLGAYCPAGLFILDSGGAFLRKRFDGDVRHARLKLRENSYMTPDPPARRQAVRRLRWRHIPVIVDRLTGEVRAS